MSRVQTLINRHHSIVILLVLFPMLVSCGNRYDEGRKVGYKAGYAKGEKAGYQRGYSDGDQAGHLRGLDEGYSSGYSEGTVFFVKENGLPSLGLVILGLLSIACFFGLYLFLRNPVKEQIEHVADKHEAQRKKVAIERELARLPLAAKEAAKARAIQMAADIYAQSRKAIGDGRALRHLDQYKQDMERVILAVQLEEIERIHRAYEQSLSSIDRANYLHEKEKAKLYDNIHQIVSHTPIQHNGGAT